MMESASFKNNKTRDFAYEKFLLLQYDQKKTAKFMLNPFGIVRSTLSMFGSCLFIFYALLFVVATFFNLTCTETFTCTETVFMGNRPGALVLELTEVSVFIFNAVEIVLNFRTGYCKENGQIEMRWQEVGKKYLKGMFLIDVLLIIPWFRLFSIPIEPELIPPKKVNIIQRIGQKIVRAFNENKIVRYIRGLRALANLKKSISSLEIQVPDTTVPADVSSEVSWKSAMFYAEIIWKSGILKLIPVVGDSLSEAGKMRNFVKHFVYSIKMLLVCIMFIQSGKERIAQMDRIKNKAMNVVSRCVHKYLARKKTLQKEKNNIFSNSNAIEASTDGRKNLPAPN